MPQKKSSAHERQLRYRQLHLRSFYSRFLQTPWKPIVLFCGDRRFSPYAQNDKKMFIAPLEHHSQQPEATNQSFEIILEDFQELPFFDNSVDTLICYYNQKFLKDCVLNEFHRVLKPSGKLILTINNRYSWDYLWESLKQSDSVYEIEQALGQYDFLILSQQQHLHLTPSLRSWLLKKIPRLSSLLSRIFGYWGAQHSFVCIKKTDFYQPLPLYMRLTQQITLPS